MHVRQPSASEDRPAIASASVVGAACLGLGLWLAHATMAHPVEVPADGTPTFDAPPPPEEAPMPEEAPPAEVEEGSTSEALSDSPSPSPSTSPSPSPSTSPSPSPSTSPSPSSLPATPSPPVPHVVGTGVASHVRHGRVAYLRCDGAPQTSGPFPCPRDEALEDTVWGAIDGATACTPPLPPGVADLVVDLDREGGATAFVVSTRDTFPDEAIRTDAAGVVACLAPPLAALTTTIPGDRIRVGFRFTLE